MSQHNQCLISGNRHREERLSISVKTAIGAVTEGTRLRRLALPRSRKRQSVIKGHIDRIAASGRHGAVDAMRLHLSGPMGRLPEIREAHPEFFTSPGSAV